MWAELRDGGLVDLDNGNTIDMKENLAIIFSLNPSQYDIILFSGSEENCKKILYRLSKKLGAIDITDLLYDEVVLDPVEAIRRLKHE